MKYYLGGQINWKGLYFACGKYKGEERCVQSFVGKPESKWPLGRPRSGWIDNIKVDLEELGCSTCTGFID
jgi:hypothetical protein